MKRNCSFLFNSTRDSVICHSARHHSTFRLSKNATTTVFKKDGTIYQTPFKNCRKAFESFLWIHKLGQTSVNEFIEAIEIDASLDNAEKAAVSAKFPEWSFKRVKTDKFIYYRATKGTAIVGGLSWQDLASKI